MLKSNTGTSKPRGFFKSFGSMVMTNDINGKINNQKMNWDGSVSTVKPDAADVEFHTTWNGRHTNLKLKNADVKGLKTNPKVKQFFQRLTRSQMAVIKQRERQAQMQNQTNKARVPMFRGSRRARRRPRAPSTRRWRR